MAADAARPGRRWRALFSWAAALCSLGALGFSFVPLGATACSGHASASSAAATGAVPVAAPGSCHPTATIVAFASAIPLLAVAVALGLVPLLTLRLRRRWPCVASALVQAALQYLGLGAFLFWLPAWLFTIASAVAPPAA